LSLTANAGYLDFARELGDHFAVMDRGQFVYASTRADIDEKALRRALAI
jgi:urea transport system ATP-binding protein